MRRAWKPVLAVAVAAAPVLAAVGTTFAAFSSTTAGSGSFTAKRIFSGERSSSAWQVEDAADGSAADKSHNIAFADGVLERTGNWTNTWSGTRYVEFEINSPLAAGLATSDVAFAFRFGDADGAGGNQWCFYFEVRRTSNGALLGAHGSSGSTIGCEALGVQTTFTTSLPEVTTSDLANDLTIRVYGMHSGGGKAIDIDRAAVTGTAYSSFTLYPNHIVDAATGTAATTYWGPAKVNSQAFQNAGNWATSYSATRYLTFTFPAYVPVSATVTGAAFEYTYKSQTSGNTTCYYFEVYAGTTLIGTHGSTSSDVDCNATTSYATIATSLSEVDTASEARTLSIKLFAKNSGSKPTLTDGVVLKVTYHLDAAGGGSCASPGTQTVTADADTYVKEDSATTNFGTGTTMNIKGDDPKRRRIYIRFPLPEQPANCSVTAATLRINATSANGAQTDVFRAADVWTETGLTWSSQPGWTGASSAATPAIGWVSWTVTSQVTDLYSGTNTGFVVIDHGDATVGTGTANDVYTTREGASNHPDLAVTFG